MPGPAIGTGAVAKNEVDWVAVLRKSIFQRGSQRANKYKSIVIKFQNRKGQVAGHLAWSI